MGSIDMMSVRGIRSFSPDEEQVMNKFFSSFEGVESNKLR